MVHKKYITRNGTRYGPYYYKSYRDGNKVRKEYLTEEEVSALEKKDEPNFFSGVKFSIFAAVLLIVIVGGAVFVAYQTQITGKVGLDVDASYRLGEPITGSLRLTMRAGELVPANSNIIASLGSQVKEMPLSNLVEGVQALNGNFYADGKQLEGSGEGYGLLGKKHSYPVVGFTLKITTPASVSEEGVEIPGSEAFMSGTASEDSGVTYGLENGQVAELVLGSVNANGQALPDSIVSVGVSGDSVHVSVDYSLDEEGFGLAYLGDEETVLDVSLANLGLTAEDGELVVGLVYGSEEIVSVSKQIVVTEISNASEIYVNMSGGGETSGTTENETLGEDVNETQTNNETSNETQATTTNTTGTSDTTGGGGGGGTETATNQSEKTNRTIVKIVTTHEPIRLRERVKWTKKITLRTPGPVAVDIPSKAENIVAKKIVNNVSVQLSSSSVGGITGKVSLEIETDRPPRILTWLRKLFGSITGKVISDWNEDEIKIRFKENASQYVLEYYTEAPGVAETLESYGKKVVVSGPDNLGYTDILTYTNIPETLPVGQENLIKVYWIEGGAYVNFSAKDRDANKMLDYIEWLTPHLSDQTFRAIILSTKNSGEEPVVMQSPPEQVLEAAPYEVVEEYENVGDSAASASVVSEGESMKEFAEKIYLIVAAAVFIAAVLWISLKARERRRGRPERKENKAKKVKKEKPKEEPEEDEAAFTVVRPRKSEGKKKSEKKNKKEIIDKIEAAVKRSKGNEWKYWRENERGK